MRCVYVKETKLLKFELFWSKKKYEEFNNFNFVELFVMNIQTSLRDGLAATEYSCTLKIHLGCISIV